MTMAVAAGGLVTGSETPFDLGLPFSRGANVETMAGLDVEILERQKPKHVVEDRSRDAEVRVIGQARGLEASVDELFDVGRERHAVLQAHRYRDRERVHDPGQRGALLGDLEEDLAHGAFGELPGGDVALGIGDPELEGATRALLG